MTCGLWKYASKEGGTVPKKLRKERSTHPPAILSWVSFWPPKISPPRPPPREGSLEDFGRTCLERQNSADGWIFSTHIQNACVWILQVSVLNPLSGFETILLLWYNAVVLSHTSEAHHLDGPAASRPSRPLGSSCDLVKHVEIVYCYGPWVKTASIPVNIKKDFKKDYSRVVTIPKVFFSWSRVWPGLYLPAAIWGCVYVCVCMRKMIAGQLPHLIIHQAGGAWHAARSSSFCVCWRSNKQMATAHWWSIKLAIGKSGKWQEKDHVVSKGWFTLSSHSTCALIFHHCPWDGVLPGDWRMPSRRINLKNHLPRHLGWFEEKLEKHLHERNSTLKIWNP